MSWSNRLLGLALAGSLSACGFQPLYGPYSAAPVTSADLASIRVAPIEDRIGQQLQYILEERLRGGRPAVDTNYTLVVKTSSVATDLGIRRDDTATRARLTLQANYILQARGQPGSLVGGMVRSLAAYDLLEANYASVIAERDAQTQAARDVADQIVAELAGFFTTRRAASAGTTTP